MRKLIVLWFYLLTHIAIVAGQPVPGKFAYRLFAHYTTDNGLIQNTITGIGRDSAGYIWLGTEMGVVRFDGAILQSFQPNINGVLLKRTGGIFTTGHATDLISYNRTPLSLLSIRDGHFAPAGSFKGVLSDFNAIATAHKPVLPFADSLNSLARCFCTTDFTGRSGYYLPDRSDHDYLSDKGNYGFYLDHGKYTRFSDSLSAGNVRRIAAVFGQRLYILSGKEVFHWVAGKYRGRITGSLATLLATMHPAELNDVFFLQHDTSVLLLCRRNIYEVAERRAGELDAVLLVARPAAAAVRDFYYAPHEGVLFIASVTSGLFVYRRSNFSVVTTTGGAAAGYSRAQIGAQGNNLFYGIEQFAANGIIASQGIFTRDGKVSSGTRTKVSRVISRTGNGMYILNATDTSLELDDFMHGVRFLVLKNVGGTCCSHNDETYIGLNGGISTFRIKGNKATFIRRGTRRISVTTNTIIRLGPDSFATASAAGFEVFHANNNLRPPRNELSGKEVRSLFPETNGDILIGTYGEGWWRYEAATRRLQRMPEDRLHYLATVHAFLPDSLGFLWLSTNNGLFRISRAELRKVRQASDPLFYNYFSKEYGFLSNEFNGSCTKAGVRLPGGDMIFPSMNGLVWFNADAVPLEQLNGNIRIDRVVADNTERTGRQQLQLPPTFNNLIIYFSSPYFGSSYNQNFEYRILKDGAQWTPILAGEPIRINRLTHGAYTLQIRALARFGGGQYITTSMPIIVLPFWYQTIWFWIGLVLLFALIAWTIIRQRTRLLEQQKRSLEEQVMLRTADLRASEEQVRKNAAFRNQITALVLHDIRSPLYYLGKITRNIYNRSSGKIPEALHDELYTLHESVSEISGYTQNLLTWLNAQEEGFSGRTAAIGVKEFLQQLCQPYRRMATENGNEITVSAPEKLSLITQPDLLNVVLRNILDNSLKHTRGGVIELGASSDAAWVIISVRDTGSGMQDEQLSQLLSPGYEDQAGLQAGLGFRIVKDLLLRLGGRLDIQSTTGTGTKVTIYLPMRNAS